MTDSPTLGLVNIGLVLFAIVSVFRLVERLLLSPLARLPGPKLAAFNPLVCWFHELSGTRRKWIHGLHLRYGPVVRIAPNEVAFASRDAIKEIYTSGGSGYDKSPFYRLFINFATRNMFSTLEKKPHAELRKEVVDLYSKATISTPDVVFGVQELAQTFLAQCTGKAGESADVYLYLHCYGFDCATRRLFDPLGTLALTDPEHRAMAMGYVKGSNLIEAFLIPYLPPVIVHSLVRPLAGWSPPDTHGVANYVMDVVEHGSVASHAVLERLRSRKHLSTIQIASECMDHILAGVETVSDALCFLLYYVSIPSSVAIQETLRAELIDNPGASWDDLPYLDAVVQESLRCFTSVPSSMPRIVPAGGRVIDGYFVPEDTTVSCQAYTVHRLDSSVWPDAEKFDPGRWLSPEGSKERDQLFFTFSKGGRGCVAKSLGYLEMKILLKEIYTSYRTTVAPDMNACMAIDDQAIGSRPKDQKCLLVFEKIEA